MTDEDDVDDCAVVGDTGCRAAMTGFGFFGAAAVCFGAVTSTLGSSVGALPAEFVPALSVCASAALLSANSSSAELESNATLEERIMI